MNKTHNAHGSQKAATSFTSRFQRLLALTLCLVAIASGTANAQKIWKNVGVPSFASGHVANNVLAIDTSGAPCVAFSDSAHGRKATVMRYDGNSWITLGSAGFSDGEIGACAIAVDRQNHIYVVYVDMANGSTATVKKYIDGTWVTTGATGFSTSSISFPSIAIGHNDTPYVAFTDDWYSYNGTAMAFNGSSWVPVGFRGFSFGQIGYSSIAIGPDGSPYVAFEDFTRGYSASVMKYNRGDTTWSYVDTAGFSHGWANYTSLAIDASGAMHVAYQDASDSNRISVMKRAANDTAHWVREGVRGFSAKAALYTDIALDPTGMPYVVYSDWNLGAGATVENFDGTEWVTSGTQQGFSAGSAKYTSIAIDRFGTPYVGYMDSAKNATVMKLGTAPIVGRDSICVLETVHFTDITPGGTWSSSDTSIATIDVNSGFLNAHGVAGTTTISYNIPRDIVTLVVSVNVCNVGVNNVNQNTSSLSVFPDPNHGAFTVHITSAQNEPVAITITNMVGQKVKELTTTTNGNIPVQIDAAPGVYFISTITSQGRQSAKVVVE